MNPFGLSETDWEAIVGLQDGYVQVDRFLTWLMSQPAKVQGLTATYLVESLLDEGDHGPDGKAVLGVIVSEALAQSALPRLLAEAQADE